MDKKTYFYSCTTARRTWARVFLNDLPLFEGPKPGPASSSTAGGVNHLLVPGENVLAMEVLHAGDVAQSVSAHIYTVAPDAAPGEAPFVPETVHFVSYPEVLDPSDEERRLPFFHESRFVVDTSFVPAWARAPAAAFDRRGTPDMRAAVAELHSALGAGDVEAFLDLIHLKLEDYAAAYPGVREAGVAYKQEAFRELFAQGLATRPLELDALQFESRAGGRVAHVTRADGSPALEAVAQKEPSFRLRAHLLLVQHEGEWKAWG